MRTKEGNIIVLAIGLFTTALVAALLVAMLIFGTKNAEATSACSATDQEMVRLFNVYRQQQTAKDGVFRANLVTTEALCRAADVRCIESTRKFYPLHYRPDGTYFNTALIEQGITYRRAAEFTFFSTWSRRSVSYVVDLWLRTEFRTTETLRPAYKQAAGAMCSGNGKATVAVALLVKP